MRARGWIWSIALAGMTAFSVWQLVRGQAIQTDLLAMLPETEKNPVAEQALKSLAKATGDRAVYLIWASDPERSKAAALRMAKTLAGSGAFEEVTAALPPIDPGMVSRFYAPYAWRL
jgi:predicted exporter